MNAETWSTVGTIVATLLLVILPGLFYTWYVLEHLIGDTKSYESVIATNASSSPPATRGP